ncbi:MAG: hypothetical protein JRH20_28045, partial [Deltaproteobacteria bacterium]|nr:hypothetical protein [Deltaproteobacteria bacterium]
KVLLAANYYDSGKVRSIAAKVNARAVIVGAMVGGEPAMSDVFDPFDVWLRRLLQGFEA